MSILKNLSRLTFCAALLPSFPAAALEQDPASLAVVEKIVQAYGGAAAIERIVAVNAEGEIKARMRGDQGSYKRWLRRSRLLRVETAYQRGAEVRILNGEQVWRSGGGGALKSISGPGALAVVYQYKQLDLPYGLLKGVYNLRHAGKEAVDGVETEVLEVSDAEGPSMRVNVDSASHYIVRVSGHITFGGAATDLGAVFSDYRLVEGVPMPFRVHNFAGGMAVSETVIHRYTVNPSDDSERFEPSFKGHHGGTLTLASPPATAARGI